MGLKENRDEAVAEAARKCEEADKAEAVAAEAQRVVQDKWDNWRQVQDSIDDDVQKIAEANLKLDDNRDTDRLIEQAEGENGEALTDEERASLLEECAKVVKEAEDTIRIIGDLTSRTNYAHKLTQEQLKAAADYQTKRDIAQTKRNEANLAEDEAADAEAVVTSIRRYLAWDGVHSEDGACNKHYGATRVSISTSARRQSRGPKEMLVSRLSSEEGLKLSAQLKFTRVSVRITDCSSKFGPIQERALFKIRINRAYQVGSLLFRVRDHNDDVVYQEILDADAIDKLPLAARRAEDHHDALGVRIDHCQEHARPDGGGRYRAQVWISVDPDTFDDMTKDADPVEVKGSCMHDRSARKEGGEIPEGDGVNTTEAKTARIVTVCLAAAKTNHPPSRGGRDARQAKDKVDEIMDAVTKGNTELGAVRAGEVRILVWPEWNFQTDRYPHLYGLDEKDAMFARLVTASNQPAAQGWLIFPGTLLWGTEQANKITAVFNTMAVVCDGNRTHTYHKHAWGMDIMPPQFVSTQFGLESKAGAWEPRRKRLNKGRVTTQLKTAMRNGPRWRIKDRAEVEVITRDRRWVITGEPSFVVDRLPKLMYRIRTRHSYAMALPESLWGEFYPDLNRNTFETGNCFAHRGARLGLDICADHKGSICATDYIAGQNNGRGNGNDEGVDIYLVSSANVDCETARVIARTGGYFLHCDGVLPVRAWRVVERNYKVRDLGQASQTKLDERYDDPENYQKLRLQRANPPRVVLEKLDAQEVNLDSGVKLHIYRMMLIDP